MVLLGQRRDQVAERNRVVSKRNRAETVSSWLVELLSTTRSRPLAGRDGHRPRAARPPATQTIRTRLAAEPELLLATLLGALGETYENLGQLPEANDHPHHPRSPT